MSGNRAVICNTALYFYELSSKLSVFMMVEPFRFVPVNAIVNVAHSLTMLTTEFNEKQIR